MTADPLHLNDDDDWTATHVHRMNKVVLAEVISREHRVVTYRLGKQAMVRHRPEYEFDRMYKPLPGR